MIKNYFKIAWRNLVKNKAHSFINIVGLSVGMAVAIMIGLWIYDEVSFNKDNPNYSRIAQVVQNVTNNGEVQTWTNVPYPLAEELRKSYGSNFKYVVMSAGTGNHILTLGDKKLTEWGCYFEPQAPELLGLKMIEGSRSALNDPTAVLLSQSTAKAYFGDADPMNKMLKIDSRDNVKVAGVYQDFPDNSDFSGFAFLATWQTYLHNSWIKSVIDTWRPNAFRIYVQMADNTDFASVSLKIRDAKLRRVSTELAKKKPALFLFPMSKWHLYSDFKNGLNIGGRIQYVWLFGIIGIFVLLLACINFMNLSTARSEKRAKEVGIRKAVGSLRDQLIYQFFAESLVYVFIAFVLSLLFVQLALPFFNSVAGKSMSILWTNPLFWLSCISFSLITGLIAGSYPAFYLSSFNPVKVLKGSFRVGRLAAIPRKVLVVVQFTVSVVLIIGTIVVFRQIQFAKNRPVGYTRDGLITVPMVAHDVHDHFDVVKSELFKTGVVANVSESSAPPTEQWGSSSGFDWQGKDPSLSVDFQQAGVSYDYGKTVAWQFTGGRDFSRDFLSDSSALIINETAVHFMGLKNPVGSTIKWNGDQFKVVGVIKDIITGSPYEQIKPAVYYLSKDAGSMIVLKINPNASASAAIDKIGDVFKQYNPQQPFVYQFVDQEYAKKFDDEERIGKLASCFAGLAIFISCLGLFGMASFMAEQRIKEIGVRKVLGASVFNLWKLLSTDFIGLVVISIIIATPTAYIFMNNWLRHYEYHSAIAWWIFALTGVGAVLITLLTVSYQSIKAALANPVKSLKSE
ncbi:ABC-type antimicrobial peptide transport system, permease component [Mucilaginibacter mallensis]|uniref:ABC-type antimicrobial peptide transport system, permease component n=1 Tax=Mucilaginibacter mallensis TaxID=652787 RepID=A0A1H2C921_MUCMA|nr:ABC transporter permease [Mucilaginibacter mallensis]SDT67048.1 ABC-type antimicrobial peptide transport system, permease component [Mucilaginibacter mallensis]